MKSCKKEPAIGNKSLGFSIQMMKFTENNLTLWVPLYTIVKNFAGINFCGW